MAPATSPKAKPVKPAKAKPAKTKQPKVKQPKVKQHKAKPPQSATHLPLETWLLIISFIPWEDRPEAWFALRQLCRMSKIAIEDVCARAYLPHLLIWERDGDPEANAFSGISEDSTRADFQWEYLVVGPPDREGRFSHNADGLSFERHIRALFSRQHPFPTDHPSISGADAGRRGRFVAVLRGMSLYTAALSLGANIISRWPAPNPQGWNLILGGVPWKPLVSKMLRCSIEQHGWDLGRYFNRRGQVNRMPPPGVATEASIITTTVRFPTDDNWAEAVRGQIAPVHWTVNKPLLRRLRPAPE